MHRCTDTNPFWFFALLLAINTASGGVATEVMAAGEALDPKWHSTCACRW
jgi:hypothetical protein